MERAHQAERQRHPTPKETTPIHFVKEGWKRAWTQDDVEHELKKDKKADEEMAWRLKKNKSEDEQWESDRNKYHE